MKKLLKKSKVEPSKKTVQRDFEQGDSVLVESLITSKDRHGINSAMRKMVGKEYEVESSEMHHSLKYMVVYLRDKAEHRWAFAPPDLKLVKDCLSATSDAMPTKPIMFDPNELI